MGISEFVKYLLEVFLQPVRVLTTILRVVEEEEGSLLPYMQEYFSTEEFPHPHCQHDSLFRGRQLRALQHVYFCSLLMGEEDTPACLIHPVVLAALVLLTCITAALSGPRHKQERSCAAFALRAEEDNPFLRRLWLRTSLSKMQQGASDFETGGCGGIADTCTLAQFNAWDQSVQTLLG